MGGESPHVNGRVRNQRPAQALSDAGLDSFPTERAWPCTQRGGLRGEADRRFPSTQTCAGCGCRPNAKRDPGVRVYRCPRCGWECDRDAYAALNPAAGGAAHAPGEAVNGQGDGIGRPGAHPDATVGEAPSDGTPVDGPRSARVVPHRRQAEAPMPRPLPAIRPNPGWTQGMEPGLVRLGEAARLLGTPRTRFGSGNARANGGLLARRAEGRGTTIGQSCPG